MGLCERTWEGKGRERRTHECGEGGEVGFCGCGHFWWSKICVLVVVVVGIG